MKNPKVLLIGIDAMDPRVARALMDRGSLPNFRKLHFRNLQTTIPPETPVAWSAASTGMNPGNYGIYDFLTRNPKSYAPKLGLAEEKPGLVKTSYTCAMRGEPFWRVLSKQGLPVTVVRWPVTFPAEKINGRMLSGLGVVDLRGSMNSFSFYTNDRTFLETEGKEKVEIVEADGNLIETHLKGPMVRKRGNLKAITTPMSIRIEEDLIQVEVGDNSFSLREKHWSPLIRVKFKVLPFLEMSGFCNMYLASAGESFQLYVSTIQIDPEFPAVDICTPAEYGKELLDALGPFYTLGMAEDTKAVTEEKLSEDAFYQQVKQIERERERMFWYEFERFEEGVLAIVFDAGDRLKHIFWNGSVDDELPKEIEEYYVQKDEMLGKVLDSLDSDTKLIVLSDHGFSQFDRQVNLNNWLVHEGYMVVKSHEETELFKQVEWTETSAYSVGFTSIFLNLEGREGKGIVPQENRQGVIDEMMGKLARLRDGKRKVFTQVYAGSEIYTGQFVDEAPDIVVGFEPGYRMAWKSAIGGLDEEIISDNASKWKADHLIDSSHVPGVLFTNFDHSSDAPHITDIAPTLYALLGVEPPEGVEGESIL